MAILHTRIWVGGIFGVLALLLSLTVGRASATGLQPPSQPGYTPPRSLAPKSPAGMPPRDRTPKGPAPMLGSGNLLYHAGPVQTGTHKTYAIYWGSSSSFSTNYKKIINKYFANVAADSGKTSNVYYSATQYFQILNGFKTAVSYSESFSGSWSDTILPSSDGCTSTDGGTTVCISDSQLRAEVSKAIFINGWPTGLGNNYFVFLGDGISTCRNSSYCAFVQFCAYHSSYYLGNTPVLYANMPYTGHEFSGCSSYNAPNNDQAADSTINVTSHEAIEMITDPLGTAWRDAVGFEGADKCNFDFGSSLGGASGAEYNQVINGAHYYLQQEWSNASSKCVLTGK